MAHYAMAPAATRVTLMTGDALTARGLEVNLAEREALVANGFGGDIDAVYDRLFENLGGPPSEGPDWPSVHALEEAQSRERPGIVNDFAATLRVGTSAALLRLAVFPSLGMDSGLLKERTAELTAEAVLTAVDGLAYARLALDEVLVEQRPAAVSALLHDLTGMYARLDALAPLGKQ
jgi:hypothetical protein